MAAGCGTKQGLGLLATLAILGASAPLSAEDNWQMRVNLESEYTDNALKTEEPTLSERQDQAMIGLSGSYENDTLLLDASYQAREHRYSEDSQRDRSLYEGQGSLMLGKAHDPAQLSISHSRDTVWNTPNAVELLENTDERDIFTATPILRWQPSRADNVELRGQFSSVEYRYSTQRDSEREGAQFSWSRSLSETSLLSLSARQTDVEFDAIPSANYSYENYSISYDVQLRRLNYRVEVGRNESDSAVGENLSSPTYLLNLGYGENSNRLELQLRQYITDNSSGSGNRNPLSNFAPGDSTAGQVDQIERQRAEIDWRYNRLCQRCSLSMTVYYQEDDYRQETEDRTQIGGSARAGYKFGQHASMNLSWRRRDESFAEDVEREGFETERWRLSYEYRFSGGLTFDLYGIQRERQSQAGARNYEESRGGIGLGYRF